MRIGYFIYALILLMFFSLIGFAIHYTGSAWCLWALVLIPSYEIIRGDGDEDEVEED